MYRTIKLFALLFLFVSCAEADEKKEIQNTTTNEINKSVPILRKVVKFEEFQNHFLKDDNKLYVINYWATWCKPCVHELPHFIELNEEFKGEKFNMTFVSLDSKSNFEDKVIPFAASKKMNADLLLLDEVKNMNEWIPKIDKEWSGSIPATAFYKNGQKLYFHEGELSKEELKSIIENYN